ncbi:hypothetical protein JCM10908_004233 [Rhodotorula pacifica]|uniref:uncharacterized protein n=1 Tax=Rhodotorula pacifica TaxID=1495444 RepID=UPI00317F8BDE
MADNAATPLTESQVVEGFHLLVRSSLQQAAAEGLLTAEEIETADVDVQIAAPSLALFFAALTAEGIPPSIASPDRTFVLSSVSCPPSLGDAFRLWQACVPKIRSYPDEANRDLALILCDKPPESMPLRMDVARTAADIKGIALEILQRRTFQTRFRADLQAALEAEEVSRPARREGVDSASARYQAPPAYDAPPRVRPHAAGAKSEGSGVTDRGPVGGVASYGATEEEAAHLDLIRETLYGALADVLVTTPEVSDMLSRGPEFAAKAFYAATCLAILEVALTRVSHDGVRAVDLGRGSPRTIGIRETPDYLRPFLSRLVEISQVVRAIGEDDDARAVREATEGVETLSRPKLDCLRDRLTFGVGAARASSGQDEIVQLANGINGLALGMTSLPAFQERQAQAFQVLAAITSL